MKRLFTNTRSFTLIFPGLIIFQMLQFSCSRDILYFENTLPYQAEITKELPTFFQGSYIVEEDSMTKSCLAFERINDQHCLVYSYLDFPLDYFLEELKKTGDEEEEALDIQFSKNSVILIYEDSTAIVPNAQLIDGKTIRMERELKYELDLIRGIYSEYSESGEERNIQKCILKKTAHAYYLNLLGEEGYWDILEFKSKGKDLLVSYTDIDTSEYNKNRPYYHGITKMEKIGKRAYFSNPNEHEFFALLEEAHIVATQTWIRPQSSFKLETKHILWVVSIALAIALMISLDARGD